MKDVVNSKVYKNCAPFRKSLYGAFENLTCECPPRVDSLGCVSCRDPTVLN